MPVKCASGEVLIDEGRDGVDVSEEFACLAPADLPGPDCPPVGPAQPAEQRPGALAGGHTDQQSRPRASNIMR